MKLLSEFREFAMRGNVVDMAIGVVIGGAFGKIVSSMVNDVLMPPINYFVAKAGGGNTSGMEYTLQAAVGETAAISIKYGLLINTLIDFVIIAFCLFIVVKAMNAMKRKSEEKPATPPPAPADIQLLTEIRDLLRK